MLSKRIIAAITKFGFYEYREIKFSEILFEKVIFEQCSFNSCGMYNKNHSCPPRSGTITEVKDRLGKYKQAFLINKLVPLDSILDSMIDMNKSIAEFDLALNKLRAEFANDRVMILGAGPCKYCIRCTALDNELCKYPEKIHYSLEGSGINVVQMSINHKMTYNAGDNKVVYFGLILF